MGEPVLKKGSDDPAVRDLQEALEALGYGPGPVDGTFVSGQSVSAGAGNSLSMESSAG